MATTIGPIGPSLGYLFAKLPDISMTECGVVLETAGVTAMELVMYDQQRIDTMLAGVCPSFLEYVSLHLDSFADCPSDLGSFRAKETKKLEICRAICRHYHVATAVYHPDVVSKYIHEILQVHRIPVAIENMDRNKSVAKTRAQIAGVALHHFGNSEGRFVLDVQHAYENSRDSGGDGVYLALSLADFMIRHGRLAHLHVSGELTIQGNQTLNHAQLHISTNRKQILQAVQGVLNSAPKSLPIILEGHYLLRVPEGYVPGSLQEREDLLVEAALDIQRDRNCLLNEINI